MNKSSRVLGPLAAAVACAGLLAGSAPLSAATPSHTTGPDASRTAPETIHAVMAASPVPAPVQVSTAAAVTVPRCAAKAPTTAAGYQKMFNAKNDATWSGGDQASTVRLPDGRVLWLFADTMQGTQAGTGYGWGARMVHNSFLIQDAGCLTAVNGPGRREVIPNVSSSQWYWPQHAVVDGGKLLVFASKVKRTGSGAFSFAHVGVDLAIFKLPTSRTGVPVFETMVATPATGSVETKPQWGQALARDAKFHYVYGTAKVNAPYHYGKSVYLARVPVGKVTTRSAWTYWTGRTWSTSSTLARPIVTSAPSGWSSSFSVHRMSSGRYQMVTKELDMLGTSVVTGSSASPAGPFTRRVVLRSPSFTPTAKTVLTYNPMAHPELKVTGGVLGHISRNSTSQAVITKNADLYKPQFFTVPSL